ncbi:hypothetical protein [Dechloromonas denitrificans]|uniref:hypothetical protein n=1 Tax=Dechloromonas denitrificans TaxID=281362 RepID=UPI001CFC0687|nr:hypothetical protein [Dechloromonas denitrificans]UCV07381.1 hypothetical protein KI615_18590 [Dechloromonas denitrificans]
MTQGTKKKAANRHKTSGGKTSISKMNYSTFRFRAVVDWIEVQIQTEKTTNFQTVQRAFNDALCLPVGLNIWTKSHDANEGGGASSFSVRIHDVRRYSDIENLLIKVCAKLVLKPGFKINKIELALDAYCDDPAIQAARFYKFMTHPVSDNRRMYHDHVGSVNAMPRTIEAITRHLSEGWQIGIGNKTDDRYQHIYFKTTDTHQGERQEVEHRARIEVRLSGAALPCQTHDAWREFKFETLAQYFRFTKLKDNLEPLIQATAEALDQIGERRARKRVHEGRESGTRLHSRATQADAELNSKARDALRKLSARWASDGKRGRQTRTMAATCCGNTGGIDEPNPHECREEVTHSNNYIYEQEEQQHKVTTSDFQLNVPETTRRNFDRSNESAKPIHSDQANNAVEDVIQQYEATPEAKNEHDRINELMGAAVGAADPPPTP